MYSPKTTPIFLFIFGGIFFSFGLIFIVSSGISFSSASIVEGEVLTYSTSPDIRYFHEGKEYISHPRGSMSCNNVPCNRIGETIRVVYDRSNPLRVATLQELVLGSIFPIIGLFLMMGWIYAYVRSKRKKDIILLLQSQGCFTESTIIDMEVVKTKSKRGSRIVGYKYLCKDKNTQEEYESDVIRMPEFEVGSSVRVIKDYSRYPGIYWVDLNTVSQNSESFAVATQYQENKIEANERNLRKLLKGSMSYGGTLTLFGIMGLILVFLAVFLQSLPFGVVGSIFLGLGSMNLAYFFREKKRQKIIEKNISIITEIVNVEKASDWKTVALGYIPEEEREAHGVDISKINDGLSTKNINIYGYKYRFIVLLSGQSKATEIFTKPFPEKYRLGARIRIYFDDFSQMGDFVADLESIDELN